MDAIRDLHLDRVAVHGRDEARRLYAGVEARFCTRRHPTWIWEYFVDPNEGRRFEDDRAYTRLPGLVPEGLEGPLHFFAGSDQKDVCVCDAQLADIVAILADSPHFEYCITPIDLAWLICENHHGVLIAVGEPLMGKLVTL